MDGTTPSHHDLSDFIQALPDFMKSPQTRDGSERLQKLLERELGYRIVDMIVSHSQARVLDVAHQSRIEACMHIVWLSPRWFCSHWTLKELVDALTSFSRFLHQLSLVQSPCCRSQYSPRPCRINSRQGTYRHGSVR